MGEPIAVRQAVVTDEPVRNGVVVPQQYAVDCAGGRHLFVAGLCGEQLADQVIDDRVGDSRIVAAAFDADLAGMEIKVVLSQTINFSSYQISIFPYI